MRLDVTHIHLRLDFIWLWAKNNGKFNIGHPIEFDTLVRSVHMYKVVISSYAVYENKTKSNEFEIPALLKTLIHY